MRRAFAIVAGLALAIPAAVVTLTIGFTGALATRPGVADGQLFLSLFQAFAWSEDPARLLHSVATGTVRLLAVACCAPIVCTALVGALTGTLSRVWYVIGTAVLSAGLPLVAASSGGERPIGADAVVIVPLLACGAVAGLVFWAVAVPSRRAAQALLPAAK